MNDYGRFGSVLQKMRAQHGISQRDLAERIGVDFTYISKFETGALAPPSEETIIKIADVFGVDRYDLITLARKIPTDFVNLILRDNEVHQYLKDKLKESEKE